MLAVGKFSGRAAHALTALLCQGLLVALILTRPAMAQTPSGQIPLPAFAQLPQIVSPVLSPDGNAIALVRPHARRHRIVVQEIAAESTAHAIDLEQEVSFESMGWASDDHLVVATSLPIRMEWQLPGTGAAVTTTRTSVFSLNRDGSETTNLLDHGAGMSPWGAELVSWLPDDPANVLLAVDGDGDAMVEVRRVNVGNGRFKTIVSDMNGIYHWLADQSGVVRYGWGDGKSVYRSGAAKFRGADDYPWLDGGWLPAGFDTGPDIVLVAGYGEGGTRELKRLDAENGEFVETVFSDSTYSFEEVVTDRQARPVGVRYTDDYTRVRYIDAELARLASAADRALPDTVNELVSFSNDLRVLIVRAASDVDPGFFNLWNRDAGKLESIGTAMPGLDPGQMSPTRSVSYDAADGLTIPAYLTVPAGSGKGLPAVVLQHEGLGARADAGFDFLVQFLASRGYAVLQPNGRGSSGYTRRFEEAGDGEWGGLMQDDLVSAAAWLIDEGIADPERICIAGRVYGGYAAAMAAVETPDKFRCAISINGILDLVDFSRKVRRFVGGEIARGDHGLSGDDLQSVSPYSRAESVGIPMMIMQVRDSVTVPYSYAERMATRLQKLDKPVQLVDLGPGGLDVYDSESQRRMLRSIETFLESHLGDRPQP